MRTILISLAITLAAAAGCAHGTPGGQGRDLRGGTRVGETARVVLAGSAARVHATGEKPVRWFVADRVKGDDHDCASPASGTVLPVSTRATVTVEAGRVLCAAVASGATDVNWHQFDDNNVNLWALR
jgi:hypothetical protein